MGSYQNITYEKHEQVAVITFNNPEQRNPMTEETKDECLSALQNAEADRNIRSLVITGRGPAFCAGGDIKRISKGFTPEEAQEMVTRSQQLLRRIFHFEKPVVAAVNGDAVGIGCNLALATDFVIASERSRFSEIFIRIGLIPDFGGLYFLPRLVGLAKSKELAYLGNMISAKEAEGIGLIYKVVPHDELEKEALEFAKLLADMPTLAIDKAKGILNRAFDMTLDEVLEEEAKAQGFLSGTEDHREGIQAVLEKRKPKFHGK